MLQNRLPASHAAGESNCKRCQALDNDQRKDSGQPLVPAGTKCKCTGSCAALPREGLNPHQLTVQASRTSDIVRNSCYTPHYWRLLHGIPAEVATPRKKRTPAQGQQQPEKPRRE
jgi:hypothetical protein